MITGRGSGVFHMCVIGGRRSYATCMGNSSCGEVNVGGFGSGCFGKVECCFKVTCWLYFWVWFSHFKVVLLQP